MIVSVILAAITASAAPLPQAAMDSPFGIVNPWPEVGAGGMGAFWCRCGGGSTQLGDWGHIQSMDGSFRWDRAESEWEAYYVKEKLVPTPILSYTPRWASRSTHPDDFRSRPPQDLWDYYEFCRRISKRFAGRIHFWEVWNEPNIGFFEGTIAEYTDMVKTAAVAIKAGSPDAYVVFGGMAGVDIPFADRCYQYGARDYFDVMAAHPYQWGKYFDDRWYFEKLAHLHDLMKEWDDTGKPVWLNEVGWSTANEKITEKDQARLLVQCFVSSIARADLGVQRIFWFCVKDWGGPGYGVYAQDGSKKPAWYAYENMVKRLSGMTIRGRLKDIPQGVRAYVFEDGDGQRAVLVVWSKDDQSRPFEAGIDSAPANAWGLSGETLDPPKAKGGRLTIEATPQPTHYEFERGQLVGSVQEIQPLEAELPDPDRRPNAWLSLYPQRGCSLPWLRRGNRTMLRGRLFNGTDRPVSGSVTVKVMAAESSSALAKARTRVAAGPIADTTFGLRVPCPKGAPERVRLIVDSRIPGIDISPLKIDAFAGDGPTINFLANSHLERKWYLEPDPKSGCSESVRFGSEWTYRIPVPEAGTAILRMDVGAHQAHEWSVSWSQDGDNWTDVWSDSSPRSWHEATIDGLEPGSLFIRCKGDNQQVGEVVVSFPADGGAR